MARRGRSFSRDHQGKSEASLLFDGHDRIRQNSSWIFYFDSTRLTRLDGFLIFLTCLTALLDLCGNKPRNTCNNHEHPRSCRCRQVRPEQEPQCRLPSLCQREGSLCVSVSSCAADRWCMSQVFHFYLLLIYHRHNTSSLLHVLLFHHHLFDLHVPGARLRNLVENSSSETLSV